MTAFRGQCATPVYIGGQWVPAHRADAVRQENKERHARAQTVKPLPFTLRQDALRQWSADLETQGWNAATRGLNARVAYVLDVARERAPDANAARVAGRDVLQPWSSDDSVKAWAARRAGECAGLMGHAAGVDAAYCAGHDYAGRFGVQAPDLKLYETAGAVKRLAAVTWWRRRARQMLTARIECAAIDAGRVHRHAGFYISDANCKRGQEAQKRNAQTLLDLMAVNELGESLSVSELAAKSTANPHLRFCELIVRIKGLEAIAERDGFVGLFITWTLPARFHARHWESGALNEKWDGSKPGAGQAYLVKQWAKVRAVFKKTALRFFGLRVAEPHHDATPHWHMMLFVPRADVWRTVRTVKRYALAESPDEKGARKHRFKLEVMKKSKGGAASYLAKYVSKMTTGRGLDAASERGADGVRREVGKPSAAALRARIWASIWKIRQFQFFGTQPIGVWREFRRIREPITAEHLPQAGPAQLELFERARAAADASDYAGHVDACGGVAVPREAHRFTLERETRPGEKNLYGEDAAPMVKGLSMRGLLLVVTRVCRWFIVPKGSATAPWTRVNNCNPLEKIIEALTPIDRPAPSNFVPLGTQLEYVT